MGTDSQIYRFTESFVTEAGAVLSRPQAAYRTWGQLNAERTNVVVVCHALTGNADADVWFAGIFGPGKVLDPTRSFIICVNVPGSCYGSTGPLTVNPETGRPYQASFPLVTIRDMVRFQQNLFDSLQINGIERVIGGSMGGMQALEFAIMDPRVRSAALIGMGKAHSAWAIGTSEAQRRAIYADPNWKDGYYDGQKRPEAGLAAARMMAMISYRTAASFERRFGRERQNGSGLFAVQSYLDYQGRKLNERFDAVSYVRLTEAMDTHDVARGRGSYEEVLGAVTIPVLVAGIDSDILYPLDEQRELARLLGNGRFALLESDYGHDAFLIEFERMEQLIYDFVTEHITLQSEQR